MTTPVAEVFGNQPTAIITSGGTTTSDTSFTASLLNTWPAASVTPTPNTVFRITDLNQPSEIMLVTAATGGTGTDTWTVTRGAEGSTPIAHFANWTAVQIITEGTLNLFSQDNFAAPQAVVPIATATAETVILSWNPAPQDAPAAGVAYTFSVYGTILTTTATLVATLGTLTFNVRWGGIAGTLLCTILTGNNATALAAATNNQGFWLEGTINCLSATSMVAGMNWVSHKSTTFQQGMAGGILDTASSNTSTTAKLAGITVSGSTGPLVVSGKWSTANNQMFASGVARRVQ